jgi:hypothetical protein
VTSFAHMRRRCARRRRAHSRFCAGRTWRLGSRRGSGAAVRRGSRWSPRAPERPATVRWSAECASRSSRRSRCAWTWYSTISARCDNRPTGTCAGAQLARRSRTRRRAGALPRHRTVGEQFDQIGRLAADERQGVIEQV